MSELILFRHSRERGNPGIPYLAELDSRIRGSDDFGEAD